MVSRGGVWRAGARAQSPARPPAAPDPCALFAACIPSRRFPSRTRPPLLLQLAYNIYNYNQGAPAVPIPLKGTLVGNGCIGNAAGHCGNDPTGLNSYHDVQQWRGHGLMSETTYDAVLAACAPNWAKPSLPCDLALGAASAEIGNVDVYDLYNTCDDPAARLRAPVEEGGLLERALAAKKAGGPIDPNCFSTTQTMQTWANQAEVKTALNVAPAITFSLCSNNRTFSYRKTMVDERVEIYPTLTQKAGYQVVRGAPPARQPGSWRRGCRSVCARTAPFALPPPPPTHSPCVPRACSSSSTARRTCACPTPTMSGGPAR